MAEQQITLEQVRHVAKLSRLALDEPHLTKLAGQLQSILGYIAKISEVDVSGVEPMAHALPVKNVFRDDVVQPSLPLAKVLQNAPDSDGPFFKVPKIIGGAIRAILKSKSRLKKSTATIAATSSAAAMKINAAASFAP